MSKYLEVTKTFLKMQLIWRTDVVFNALLSITKFLFAYLLWGTIFAQKDTVGGFTFSSMISYYIINSFLSQMDRSKGISEDISKQIRNGTFSKYLILPICIERYYISKIAGEITFYLVFDFAAAVLWVVLFRLDFVFTKNVVMIFFAVILIILGLLFMAQLNYYLGILTLKYEDINIFLMIKDHILALVTGSIIPVALFPEIVVKVMKFLPFYYVTYLPSMLLIGKYEADALRGILIISVWCIVIQIVINIIWRKYRRKYDGVGI